MRSHSVLHILFFILASSWVSSGEKISHINMQTRQNSERLYDLGMTWLINFQNRPWTKRAQIVIGDVGQGFASMFQHSALKFGECVATNRGAEFVGHYKEYTKNDMCKNSVLWNRFIGQDCFFQHIHNRTQFGQEERFHKLHPRYNLVKAMPVPVGLPEEMTSGRWWGILQSYMFRLNKRASDRFAEISNDLGMPMGHKPDIGVHIRLGDKLGDAGSRQGQFAGMSEERIVSLYLQEVNIAIEHLRSIYCPVAISETYAPNVTDCAKAISVYVATDSIEAVALVRQWGSLAAASISSTRGSKVTVYVRSHTTSQIYSGRNTSMGAILRNMKDSYSAAEEIIYDMHMLSQCEVLVGLIMSQIARAAVSMSYAAGRLEYAVAIDSDNLNLFRLVDPQWHVSGLNASRNKYN